MRSQVYLSAKNPGNGNKLRLESILENRNIVVQKSFPNDMTIQNENAEADKEFYV